MTNNQKIIQLTNQLALERQCSDQMFDALCQGGLDRAFEAMRFHELCRNGMLYGGAQVPSSPESKPKKKTKQSPNHPSIRYKWARPDHKNQDFWIRFQQEQDKPYDQDEENQ